MHFFFRKDRNGANNLHRSSLETITFTYANCDQHFAARFKMHDTKLILTRDNDSLLDSLIHDILNEDMDMVNNFDTIDRSALEWKGISAGSCVPITFTPHCSLVPSNNSICSAPAVLCAGYLR